MASIDEHASLFHLRISLDKHFSLLHTFVKYVNKKFYKVKPLALHYDFFMAVIKAVAL